jgi:hypothetical protein
MDGITKGKRHLGTGLRFLAVTVLALLTLACDNRFDITASLRREALASNNRVLVLSGSIPAPNSVGIAPDADLSFSFDRALDIASVTADTIKIVAQASGALVVWTQTYDETSRTLSLRTDPYLEDNTVYTVTLAGLKGADGSEMAEPISYNFGTSFSPKGTIILQGSDPNSQAGYTKTKLVTARVLIFSNATAWAATSSLEAAQNPSTIATWSFPNESIQVEIPEIQGEQTVYAVFKLEGTPVKYGKPVEETIIFDTLAPPPPVVLGLADDDDTGASNTDNLTNRTSNVTIEGTADALARVTVKAGGTDKGTCVADANGFWSVDIGLSTGTIMLSAVSMDSAGNTATSTRTCEIQVDTSPPTITSFSINSGNPATTAVVNNLLSSTAIDAGGTGLYQCRAQNEGGAWGTWVDYELNTGWNIQDKVGSRRVYFEVSDRAGNISEIATDDIIMFARLSITYESLVITYAGDSVTFIDPNNPGEIYFTFRCDGAAVFSLPKAANIQVYDNTTVITAGRMPFTTAPFTRDPRTGSGAFTLTGTVIDDDAGVTSDEIGTMAATQYNAPFSPLTGQAAAITGDVTGEIRYRINFENP